MLSDFEYKHHVPADMVLHYNVQDYSVVCARAGVGQILHSILSMHNAVSVVVPVSAYMHLIARHPGIPDRDESVSGSLCAKWYKMDGLAVARQTS